MLQKRNGPKIRIPKSSKSSGPVEEEEDIEIEIAEVLYGLMKQAQNSKTSKFETEDRNGISDGFLFFFIFDTSTIFYFKLI